MDVQQVEAFLAVADELHFGRAAERLVQSRPRVSKLIASLEREVGGALFDRTSRRVRLTPLGTRFRDQLRPGYAQMQAALADARAAATQASGVLRVGFTVTTGGEALTRLVTVFESAHPGCQVILNEVGIGDPYAPLRRDEIDVLVNWLAVDEPNLTAGPVIDRCDRALAVAAGHSLAAGPPVTAEDLADLEMAWIPPSLPTALYDALLPPRTPSGRPIRRTPGSGPAPHPRDGRERPHGPSHRRLPAARAAGRHHPHPDHRPAAAPARADLVHHPRERPHPRARADSCHDVIAVTEQHVRGGQRRGPAGPLGPGGPRQRGHRDLPARGERRGPGDHERDRILRPGRAARRGSISRTALSQFPGQSRASGNRANGRRSRSRATARQGAIDPVTANWTIVRRGRRQRAPARTRAGRACLMIGV